MIPSTPLSLGNHPEADVAGKYGPVPGKGTSHHVVIVNQAGSDVVGQNDGALCLQFFPPLSAQ